MVRQQADERWGIEQHIGVWGWVIVIVALYLTGHAWIIRSPYELVRVDSAALTIFFQFMIGPVFLCTLILFDEYLFARRFRWYRRTFRNMHWPRFVLNVTLYGLGLVLTVFSLYFALISLIDVLA